jgi:UDP-N-acetylmuramyl tripeptide synthase
MTDELPLRSRAAILAGKGVAQASKLARQGTGSVIGGRVSLAIDHGLLASLTRGREVALVSATNGKTTTTHLLATALSRHGPVVSNSLGANMPPGLVAALSDADADARAVLEVDEQWLAAVLRDVGAATVVLINLSRDQLDRSHEVRRTADAWRDALGSLPTTAVVANADDPLVVWAAATAPRVVWVGTEAHWTNDAASCPACGSPIEFTEAGPSKTGPRTSGSWACTSCDFAKPTPSWWLDADGGGRPIVRRSDPVLEPIPLDLALPGRVNAANAAVALAAAVSMGAEPDRAARALASVDSVAGRYRTAHIAGAQVRMLLAKNPAGWQEAIDMLAPPPVPVVAAINARIADGRDPSWLWDVPYERLAGRFVVALGERRHDLAVRLHYAEVDHAVAATLPDAVALAADHDASSRVDLIANYTAFQDYLDEVGREP